ncbi:hypothetical protein D3227_37735 [Mesorhizobium waimense]|uniref:Uncharacterized protein n=1 Tax=Mesorhizobium waimense TaxID=1300307 RepID=A0A3A5JTE8_9HYPH|nr:hypothetical protein D3227_37735 [Mesorhizobium waimense]
MAKAVDVCQRTVRKCIDRYRDKRLPGLRDRSSGSGSAAAADAPMAIIEIIKNACSTGRRSWPGIPRPSCVV